jgi:hypothetical protein
MEDIRLLLLEKPAQPKPGLNESNALALEIEHWNPRRLEIGPKGTGAPPLFKVSHCRLYPEAL